MGDVRRLGGVALRLLAGAAVASVLAAAPLRAQDPEGQFFVTRSELYVNATLIDGRGGPPRPESAILVYGGEIQAVGSRSQMVVPEGTTVVDLEGSWIVPGFIDAHASPRSAEDLDDMLASGITAVREAAMPLDRFRELGREAPGSDPQPTLLVGGPVLDGGIDPEGVVPDGPEEAVRIVEEQIEEGAPFLSIGPGFHAGWIVDVARAARRLDTPVWADPRGDGWLLAVRAGVDVISRIVSRDPALLGPEERESRAPGADDAVEDLVAWLARVDPDGAEVDRAIGALLSRDASLVPLLAATEAPLACVPGSSCEPLSQEERAAIRDVWPRARALVQSFREAGVRLVVGSGAPAAVAPGRGFHRELELLVEAGLSPVQVLAMATRNGAIALELLHERGTIEADKRADFVVLEADPVADIRNARRVAFVVLGGVAWQRDPDEGGWERLPLR